MTNIEVKTLIDPRFKNKLAAAFINIRLQDNRVNKLQDIIDEVNSELGLNYKPQRLMDWRNGATPCPKKVTAHMRACVIHELFPTRCASDIIDLLGLEQ